MLQRSRQHIPFILLTVLVLLPICGYSQARKDSISCDTSKYVPVIFSGSMDYNLMIAASNGCLSQLRKLLADGADVMAETQDGVTPLIFAVSNNHLLASRLLLQNGSDPNKMTNRGETPLLISVKNQNAEIAEDLIRAGSAIDTTDRYGATPLHYASVYDYFQIADMLIYYGAAINTKTKEGTTPLLASVWAGNADITDLLIQNGADIETGDNDGFTPFLMAALNGDTLIMKLLIKNGSNIYANNYSGQNALSLSIIADKIDAVKFLLEAGDKWAQQGKQSVNPYSAVSKYRRTGMLPLLHEYKIPGNLHHEIDQINFALSSRFSLHDIYTGMSFSVKEPFINGGIIAGFDTKLWYTKVLIKEAENTYYQYYSKESLIYAGAFKNFYLTNHPLRSNFEVSTSLSAGYEFGAQFKGTQKAPPDKLVIIPAITLIWEMKDLSFSAGAEYLNSSFYHSGPVWLRLGASYNLFFDNVRIKKKTLKWY